MELQLGTGTATGTGHQWCSGLERELAWVGIAHLESTVFSGTILPYETNACDMILSYTEHKFGIDSGV